MSCIDVALNHVSIRKYVGEEMSKEHVELIVEVARRAPSSWGIQPVSVIVVRDDTLKARIAELVGGQEHVAKAPLFLVFAIDYAKVLEAAKSLGVSVAEPGLGHLAIALIDVGIASAWAALAAEQLGYGITFIAVYESACEIADLLKLPAYTLPVVGLTVGKPAERPSKQPRHPLTAFMFDDGYGDYIRAAKEILSDEKLRVKYEKIFPIVLSKEGFNKKVGEKLENCLPKRGFKL